MSLAISECSFRPKRSKDAIIDDARRSIVTAVMLGVCSSNDIDYDKVEEFFKTVKEFDFENTEMSREEVNTYFNDLARQCVNIKK
jgi:uncharacterized membrane protein (DUF106 family)